MGYFEMNLNMAIAFRVYLSYNFDPLYDYFNQEFIYYISEKYIIKFQSNIGLICGKDLFIIMSNMKEKVEIYVL